MVKILDVIKEYLISLGFDINKTSFNQAQKTMNDADKMVSKFASSSVTQFAIASAGVLSFVAAATVGLAKYMDGLAQADLKNQQFARLMWTSNEAAMSYNNTMEAMGATMQDLLLSPELMGKFQSLRKQAGTMGPPSEEYANQMKYIRSITFEFQRLKLEGAYAMQWIGYYVFKYLEEPIKQLKTNFGGLNDSIQKHMPEWTQKVGQVVSWIGRLALTVVHLGMDIDKMWDSLGTKTKMIGGIMAGFFMLLKMGPIGWIITGMLTLLALLDDYYTYENGGESALPELWKWVDDLKQAMADSGVLKEYKKSIEDVASELIILKNNLFDVLNKLAQLAGFDNFGDLLEKGIINGFRMLEKILDSVAGLLETINGLLSKDWGSAGEGLKKFNKNIFGMLFDSISPGASDKIMGGLDDLSDWFGKMFEGPKTPNMPNSPSSYIYPKVAPQAYAMSDFNPSINIYGAEPISTARAAGREMETMYIRYLQGVIR